MPRKRLGHREYVMMVAESLSDTYGNTLWEDGTDIRMALDLLEKIKPYLLFSKKDVTMEEFIEWRVKHICEICNVEEEEIRGYHIPLLVESFGDQL